MSRDFHSLPGLVYCIMYNARGNGTASCCFHVFLSHAYHMIDIWANRYDRANWQVSESNTNSVRVFLQDGLRCIPRKGRDIESDCICLDPVIRCLAAVSMASEYRKEHLISVSLGKAGGMWEMQDVGCKCVSLWRTQPNPTPHPHLPFSSPPWHPSLTPTSERPSAEPACEALSWGLAMGGRRRRGILSCAEGVIISVCYNFCSWCWPSSPS